MRQPDPALFMTVADLDDDDLPSGTASIVRLAKDDGTMRRATVDDAGFLRTTDGNRYYFRASEWSVAEGFQS